MAVIGANSKFSTLPCYNIYRVGQKYSMLDFMGRAGDTVHIVGSPCLLLTHLNVCEALQFSPLLCNCSASLRHQKINDNYHLPAENFVARNCLHVRSQDSGR